MKYRILSILLMLALAAPGLAALSDGPYYCTTAGTTLYYERYAAGKNKLLQTTTIEIESVEKSGNGRKVNYWAEEPYVSPSFWEAGSEPGVIYKMINPEIIASSGSQNEAEGCLSIPGKWGSTERPATVTVRATGLDGRKFELTGEGLLARAFCHELDHLDGVLYIDRMEGELLDNTYVPEEE